MPGEALPRPLRRSILVRDAVRERKRSVVSPSSVKLFTAWAAKHKQVLDIEDRWNVAVRDNHPSAPLLQLELAHARLDSERMLAQAQGAFHEELKARGLRE